MSLRRGLPGLLALWLAGVATAAVSTPPAPASYFNDYAGFVSAEAASRLDAKLRAFDEQSTSQVVVAIFPKLPSPSLEDFTVRTAEAWRVGRADLDNGAVLFVFVEDRKLRIEVGYGLEAALPDALAKRILDDVITPRLRAGQREAALESGIDAILAATRGEYRPPPSRAQPRQPGLSDAPLGFVLKVLFWLVVAAVIVPLVITRLERRFPSLARSGGSSSDWGSSGWSGGSSWGSSGGSSGGFSGGGGSFGGGGASGSW